ncbi:MAG: protein-methionine-sulfoxide reductase catalytic subunit MsrP, partial [Methylobacterium sp.]
MLIKRLRGWEIPEHLVTPESVFLDRRALLGGSAGLAAAAMLGGRALAETGAYPARRNDAYALDRPLTPEKFSGDYNNFYEFGTSKTVLPAADALKT